MPRVQTNTYVLLGFWALVFLINTGPHWQIYSSPTEMILTVGLITLLQFFVAFFAIKWLIPKTLDLGNYLWFFVGLLFLIVLAAEVNVAVRYLYLEPAYAESYERFLELYGDKNMRQRMFSLWALKYIFFTKIPLYLYPAVIWIANDFHQQQKNVLKLNEQKQRAELAALKNQLNPHFIFNTLNNLYALALKKSDQTPVVIEKLSHILDYVMYRCQSEFVALADEIKLIQNYIDLEKIRFGNRIQIEFEHSCDGPIEIAPLILLTVVENACKHSTKEELGTSNVFIKIKADNQMLHLKVTNSKPQATVSKPTNHQPIGLANMKKQLAMIYPDKYSLQVTDQDQFMLELRIQNP